MDEVERDLDVLLLLLRDTRGFDFTGYRRTTLTRRIVRRMSGLGFARVAEYRDHLEREPREYADLFDSLLINVTGFFRDAPSWDVLRGSVLPELLACKRPDQQVRVWSAGCASGEEAYTLAICLAELLGPERYRDRVKIYATDLDEHALRTARAGCYSARQVQGVPEGLLRKYFDRTGPGGRGFRFDRDLRRQVVFGRNDLIGDAPISRVDLLVARNTLMYFNAETQAAVIRRFHFALSDPGFLFLGKAEMLLDHGDRFEPVALRKRIFRKIPAAAQPVRTARPPRLHRAPERSPADAQSLNEELETTYEELQSAKEELETANEELQSTNEELETMNEELQSANDELQETNEILRIRSGELDRTRELLDSVLRGIGDAAVVLGPDLAVRLWNPGAEELWGLRAAEVTGANLLDLDIGLPVGALAATLRQLLADAPEQVARTTFEMDALDRRGHGVRIRLTASVLGDLRGDRPRGAVVIMDQSD